MLKCAPPPRAARAPADPTPPSPARAYRNLSARARLGVGVGVIAWGAAGLYLSDRAEDAFGYTPSEKDKEDLRAWAPRIVAVDKPPSSAK